MCNDSDQTSVDIPIVQSPKEAVQDQPILSAHILRSNHFPRLRILHLDTQLSLENKSSRRYCVCPAQIRTRLRASLCLSFNRPFFVVVKKPKILLQNTIEASRC